MDPLILCMQLSDGTHVQRGCCFSQRFVSATGMAELRLDNAVSLDREQPMATG